MFEATVRMVIWNYSTMGQPSTLVLSATTTVWLPGTPPQRIHEYLCDGQRRGEWDRFAYDGPVQELSSIVTCRQLPGNVVSVLHPNDVSVSFFLFSIIILPLPSWYLCRFVF
jgi:homeobox-leucine zipper protein